MPPETSTPRKPLTSEQVAEIIGKSRHTVNRFADRGVLPCRRLTPTSPREFQLADVLALLEPHDRKGDLMSDNGKAADRRNLNAAECSAYLRSVGLSQKQADRFCADATTRACVSSLSGKNQSLDNVAACYR